MEVELDRPASVGPIVRLRDLHASPGVLVREHQILSAPTPSMSADEIPLIVADDVVAPPPDDRPGLPAADDADPRSVGRALPEPDTAPPGGEMDRRTIRCQLDTDPRGHGLVPSDPCATVEVLEDPLVPPAHLRQPVCAPLRHPETVTVAGAEEPEGRRGARGCPTVGAERRRQQQRADGDDHDTTAHGWVLHPPAPDGVGNLAHRFGPAVD